MFVTFDSKTFPVKIWNGETIHSPIVAWDTETLNFSEGFIPPLVVLQVFDGETSWLADYINGRDLFKQVVQKEMILHNAAYDFGVINKEWGWEYWDAVEQDRVWDTGVLWRLSDLARRGQVGRWSLDFVCEMLYKVEVDKNPNLRMNWERKPLREQPEDRLHYAALDPVATWFAYQKLKWVRDEPHSMSHRICLQGEIALSRTANRGIGFDLGRKGPFLVSVQESINDTLRTLASHGYIPGVKGIQQVLQNKLSALEEEHQIILPRTDGPKKLISSAKEDLQQFQGDEFIDNLLKYKENKKLLDFFRLLNSDRIYTHFNGILNTGRVSSTTPNLLNLPRRPGVRECFIPKHGNLFVIVDYAMLELYTLSATCYHRYGFSQMREILNSGVDLHKWFASKIFNKDIQDVTKAERQASKSCNFGYPGGLGAKKFVTYAKGYGCNYNIQEAQQLKDLWVSSFPEMEYFLADTIPNQFDWSDCPIPEEFQVPITTRILRGAYKSNTGNPYQKEWLRWVWNSIILKKDPWFSDMAYNPEKHFNRVWSEATTTITGRKRANANYNASRNTTFQGLGSDIAKLAMWKVEKAGWSIVLMVHDELLVEVEASRAQECLMDVCRLMIEAEEELCVGMKGAVEGAIKERWSK
jgi:DNA polymerase I-like protein with 3'-5' exonuclease and polymerase domains